MKRFAIFIILAIALGCIENDIDSDSVKIIDQIIEEDTIEKRKVIGQINNVAAFLSVENIGNNKKGFVFELQKPGEFKFLSVLDSDLICGTYSKEDCLLSHQYYLNNYNPRLWYRISGDVKEFNVKDGLSGNPFVLTKAERILSCPVPYILISSEVSLVNVLWRFLGFIDDNGEIYSHPSCEFTDLIKFTADSPFIPKGKVEIPFYSWQSFYFIRKFSVLSESKKIALEIVPATYGHPRHPGIPSQKMDSLAKVIGYDTIDYVLENNILKLKNSKKKLNAMFVAN